MVSFVPAGLVQWTDHTVGGPPQPVWTLEKTENWTLEKTENSLAPVG